MAMSLNQDGGRVTEDIYSKPVQITVKSTDLVERNCVLFLSAQLQSPSTSHFRKEFVLRLTDETDPLFLYHLRLSDEDYQNLRVNQGLSDDFAAFPSKFVDYMNWCSEERSNDSKSFKIQLEMQHGFGVLNIIERRRSHFKPLVHLVLKLSQGSDAEIKRYLADTVKQLTSSNASMKNAEVEISKRFREVNEILHSTSRENEKVKNELKDQSLLLMEQRKLNREKDKTIEIQCEAQQKSERERQKMEYEHNRRVSYLENKNADLEGRRQDLEDIKCKSESTINGMRTQISLMERELQTAQNEIKTLRKVEEYKSELEQRHLNLTQKFNNSERDAVSKESEIADLQELLATTKKDLNRLKSKHADTLDLLERKRQECKDVNKKIEVYMAHLQKLHLYNKDRSAITKAQELVLQNKEKEVATLLCEKNLLKEKLDNQEKEILQLKDSLKESELCRKDQEEKLRKKENIIDHLNQKLNNAEMGAPSRFGGLHTSNPLTSSTPIGVASNISYQQPNFSDKTDRLKLSSVDEDEEGDRGHGLSSKYNNKENRIGKFSKPVVPRSTSRGSAGLSNINKEKIGQPKNIYMYNDKIPIPKSVLSTNNAGQCPISYRDTYFQQ